MIASVMVKTNNINKCIQCPNQFKQRNVELYRLTYNLAMHVIDLYCLHVGPMHMYLTKRQDKNK